MLIFVLYQKSQKKWSLLAAIAKIIHKYHVKVLIQIKIFENLKSHTDEVMTELSVLKNTYKSQCDMFIEQLAEVNRHLNDDIGRLTENCHELDTKTAD